MVIVIFLKPSNTLYFYQYERQFEPCLPSKHHLFPLLYLLNFNHSDLSISQNQQDLSYASKFKFTFRVT